jgi:hypothetical protein
MRTLLRSLTATLLAVCGSAHGAGIAWFNDDSDTLPMIQADGSYLDNSFIFEIGTFTSGFDPALNPYSTWAANWRMLDQAKAPVSSGWNSVDPGAPGHDILDSSQPAFNEQYVSEVMAFNSNGTVQGMSGSPTFSQGEQGWLWVYNTQAITGSTQWALVRDNTIDLNPANTSPEWLLPSMSAIGDDLWFVNNADLAVIGAINNVDTGINRGSGSYSNDLGGAFRLQTTVIPEPSAAFLILVSGLSVQLRRRRGRGALSIR